MSARIRHLTIDCAEPFTLSRFWIELLGFVDDPEEPAQPGDEEVELRDPMGRHPALLFIAVPEAKQVKNRLHLDLQPAERRDVAVEAAVNLGATLVDDRRRPDGSGWVVLADPEGNEFCLERSATERGTVLVSYEGEDQLFPAGLHTADERQMLSDLLDWYRGAVVRKLHGISLATLRTSPVGSGTTIAGLVKHLALVEDSWFDDRFAGSAEPEPWASAPFDADPDWEFHSAVEDSIEALIALYDVSCARSRRAAEGHGLDDRAVNASLRLHPPLRLPPPARRDRPPSRADGHPARVPRRDHRRMS